MQNGSNGRDKVGLGSVRRPVIGLALGGGAARGFAHIGILRALIAHGIVPNVVGMHATFCTSRMQKICGVDSAC